MRTNSPALNNADSSARSGSSAVNSENPGILAAYFDNTCESNPSFRPQNSLPCLLRTSHNPVSGAGGPVLQSKNARYIRAARARPERGPSAARARILRCRQTVFVAQRRSPEETGEALSTPRYRPQLSSGPLAVPEPGRPTSRPSWQTGWFALGTECRWQARLRVP